MTLKYSLSPMSQYAKSIRDTSFCIDSFYPRYPAATVRWGKFPAKESVDLLLRSGKPEYYRIYAQHRSTLFLVIEG